MYQSVFSPIAQNLASSSSTYRSKRKVSAEDSDSEQDLPAGAGPRCIRSPLLKRRATFPVPELMTDHSASNSDEDVNMDMDVDGGMGMESPNDVVEAMGFAFGTRGSGGFGFGPGMEEDEMEESLTQTQKAYPHVNPYPSLQATSNLGHLTAPTPLNFFSHLSTPTQIQAPTLIRATSPLTVQPFSTSLAPPSARLLQPTAAAPLQSGASEVEKARAAHGPQCKSIPKLMMSQYGNEDGERSMWTLCGDCGAMERAA